MSDALSGTHSSCRHVRGSSRAVSKFCEQYTYLLSNVILAKHTINYSIIVDDNFTIQL